MTRSNSFAATNKLIARPEIPLPALQLVPGSKSPIKCRMSENSKNATPSTPRYDRPWARHARSRKPLTTTVQKTYTTRRRTTNETVRERPSRTVVTNRKPFDRRRTSFEGAPRLEPEVTSNKATQPRHDTTESVVGDDGGGRGRYCRRARVAAKRRFASDGRATPVGGLLFLSLAYPILLSPTTAGTATCVRRPPLGESSTTTRTRGTAADTRRV